MKPGFFKNEELADLGPEAQLLFSGLWTLADRKGRLEDRPRRIKAELFPFYEVDVNALLGGLSTGSFILRYQIDGVSYIQINNFEKHQNPHIKEQESTIPAPGLNGASSGISGTCPADSLNPLTDSLNPITTLSGLPPDAPIPKKINNHNHTARSLLIFLNEKTGRNYQPVKANIDMIAARLKEGATERQCKLVVLRKFHDWGNDEKMVEYLRPATLFNRTKFAQYVGEIPKEESNG